MSAADEDLATRLNRLECQDIRDMFDSLPCSNSEFAMKTTWICETGDLKRDKFLLLWWWIVVVSTMFWLALRLGLKDKKSGLDALAVKQSLV